MTSQGFKPTFAYQDNQSAILLEKNGRLSSSKRTRHFNIRYFFITDRISKREISIEYCPTQEMIGDFFTKPLQGHQFRKLRAIILNLPMPDDGPSSGTTIVHRSELENRDTDLPLTPILMECDEQQN